ncbi:hypothetical protein F5888DRAFT_1867499 [Russula emetica]|nr:hypothetical protein F5888DRAFT_1867499 [Russula emetica]
MSPSFSLYLAPILVLWTTSPSRGPSLATADADKNLGDVAHIPAPWDAEALEHAKHALGSRRYTHSWGDISGLHWRRYALDVVFKLRPANPAYPPSGHGPDIYCAPSPYRGAPEHAILSRSRGPSPNPMGGSGPGMYGQRAPSPIPGAMPSYGGNRSRAPSPIPGTLPPGQYPQPLNRSRAPSPLGAPPPYTGSLVSHTLMLFRGPRVLEWHWLKPSSGPWLPVQDETGFASMLKKVKSKFEPYVIVRMQAPVKKKAAESSENTWDAVDEAESNFEDRPGAKKVKLDDALEEIVIRLGNKYAPGMCSLHPDLPCFHHRASDLHFNLDRPRLLVWAQAIKSGSATYEKVPILSPMFKAQLALKRASQITTNSNTTVATGMTPPLPTYPYPYHSTRSDAAICKLSTLSSDDVSFNISADASDASVHGLRGWHSPPSSPPTANCTVAHFCETYDLGEDTEVGLQKLGFHFGDDLTTLTPEEYTNTGFKPLEWRRVLKAYKRLKRDNRY